MEKEQVLIELEKCRTDSDTESAHVRADDVLCEFLEQLGHSDVVKKYNEIDRWFA